jgi:hypothetical protein
MKLVVILLSLLTTAAMANQHKHDHHNWLDDKAAFESTKMLDMESFNISRNIVTPIVIDQGFLKTKLSEYSGAKKVLIDGVETLISERKTPQGRTLGRKFLKDEYEKLGFKVSTQLYSPSQKGSNFIAEKIGDDPSKVLIISSHIDTVRTAGANDDGTGTISALAVAKVLASYKSKYTLRVVGFDQEEIGLVGAGKYVKTLDKNSLIGDIQLEMMGTNSRADGVFHVIDCDKDHSKFMTEAIAQSIVDQGIDLKINRACTQASDHAKFWRAGLPAVVLSENFFGGDSDPCYHKKCDVVDDRIDFEYMQKITQAVAGAVKKLIQAYK